MASSTVDALTSHLVCDSMNVSFHERVVQMQKEAMDRVADMERQLGALIGAEQSLRLAHGALEAKHAMLV